MKIILLGIIILLPQLSEAQYDVSIRWMNNLSWKMVKEKAKKENKYIFLDCYATWCAPCKMMEKSTYSNDSVGLFFNDKFISVKVQMDRKDNDNHEIRNWYDNADSIRELYHVNGFPTFLF